MPRPIKKEDVVYAKESGCWSEIWKLKNDQVLGLYIYDRSDHGCPYAYQKYNTGSWFVWVSEANFKRRSKIGHPAPRKPRKKKSQMPESDFSLEELALAETIMNGG